ncbi:MAG: hypothetical protein OXC60_04840 [Litoreibacter sp.]|nr:hypothetical protein [Litoreibacter sp.]
MSFEFEPHLSSLPVVRNNQQAAYLPPLFQQVQVGQFDVQLGIPYGALEAEAAELRRAMLYFDMAFCPSLLGNFFPGETGERRYAKEQGFLHEIAVRNIAMQGGYEKSLQGTRFAFDFLRLEVGSNVVASSHFEDCKTASSNEVVVETVHWDIGQSLPTPARSTPLQEILEFNAKYGGQLSKLNELLSQKTHEVLASDTPRDYLDSAKAEVAGELEVVRKRIETAGIDVVDGASKVIMACGSDLANAIAELGAAKFFDLQIPTEAILLRNIPRGINFLKATTRVVSEQSELKASPLLYAGSAENRIPYFRE